MTTVNNYSNGIPLLPHVKHYDWGGRGRNSFLRRFLGSKDMKTPFAEAWYGTHPQGPATVAGTNLTLPAFLKRHPQALGLKPGDPPELPFMVKIIEARRPLSLQVHPNKAQAEAGFRRENAQGIPLDSPDRCFRDRNAKPEALLALRSFDVLAGFAIRRQIWRDAWCRKILSLIDCAPTSPRLIMRNVFGLSPDRVWAIGRQVFQGRRRLTLRERWLVRLWKAHGLPKSDPACLAACFMNFYRLMPGDILKILPGVPHIYLRGVGVEVMKNSDNVLRLGLTSKPISIFSALNSIRFDRQVKPVPAQLSKN